MNTFKIKGHESAQCKVNIFDDGQMTFISYQTCVIEAKPLSNGMYELSCSGLYSATTRKQIGWFMREYFGTHDYYDIKEIAGTDKTLQSRLTKTIYGGR